MISSGICTKTGHSEQSRIAENFDVNNFEISKIDMMRIEKLDRGSPGRTFEMDKMSFAKTDQDMKALKEFPHCKEDDYDPSVKYGMDEA